MILAKVRDKKSYHSSAPTTGEQSCIFIDTVSSYIQQTIKPVVVQQKLAFTPNVLQPKILLYSHDTFGLGNIRRTLLLAENLINEYARASVLIITGSARYSRLPIA